MRSTITFVALLLCGLSASAPTKEEDDDEVIVSKDFFLEELIVYSGEHDIVNILVPLNDLNFEDVEDSKEDSSSDPILFFVLADIKNNGEKDYKGLHLLQDKKGKEILPNGRDAAATNDDSKDAFFAADDGIYIFNHNTTSASKYGTFDKSSMGITKMNGSDAIFVLTDDKELYKITNAGTEHKKIDDVKNAEQIVLDYGNNLYFYSADKVPYVYNGETVKKIEGLPENPSYASLLKPPFVIDEGVPFIANNQSYIIYANGTSEVAAFKFTVYPTAYSMEGTLIQFAAYDKKIYEYNVLAMILGETLDQLKNFFNEKKDSIQDIATRSRTNFGAN